MYRPVISTIDNSPAPKEAGTTILKAPLVGFGNTSTVSASLIGAVFKSIISPLLPPTIGGGAQLALI